MGWAGLIRVRCSCQRGLWADGKGQKAGGSRQQAAGRGQMAAGRGSGSKKDGLRRGQREREQERTKATPQHVTPLAFATESAAPRLRRDDEASRGGVQNLDAARSALETSVCSRVDRATRPPSCQAAPLFGSDSRFNSERETRVEIAQFEIMRTSCKAEQDILPLKL